MNSTCRESSVFNRWLSFSLVGILGIAVQMTSLFVLTSCLGLGYLAATGLSVEVALVHNFAWHERWTWADRSENFCCSLTQRLLRFHITNGSLSLAGNLLLTMFFVEKLGLNYLMANGFAIAACSIANFIAGNCFVFRNAAAPLQKGGRNE
jgi:putative flippase GtrA